MYPSPSSSFLSSCSSSFAPLAGSRSSRSCTAIVPIATLWASTASSNPGCSARGFTPDGDRREQPDDLRASSQGVRQWRARGGFST
ncbi:hypothetical protein BS50DRAFT_678664 [Corynespora cassiicola Philippines]|uniref:Uncharacterized protein n=1 Tax=Corynespora cassiicola Philippines TaxID=1448308 RepID=A0A2T2NGN1_CORCC|nr:hypothetical protein BS50DRAFT_678664 [Corynespora cassiicola Philippines]